MKDIKEKYENIYNVCSRIVSDEVILRQTGRTSCIMAISRLINAFGKKAVTVFANENMAARAKARAGANNSDDANTCSLATYGRMRGTTEVAMFDNTAIFEIAKAFVDLYDAKKE